MISALNMDLEPIRTVLRNDVNELTVCVDRKRDTGAYYTMISIKSGAISKKMARQINTDGLFTSNNDFLGSFIYQDTLNLVFHYHRESLLKNREALYAAGFEDRKTLAVNLLIALAETETTGSVGNLILHERNINVAPGGKIYLNYFMDFAQLEADDSEDNYYRNVAGSVFSILAREYEDKYDQQIDYYPQELRLFYKKISNRGFHSHSQIMTFVRGLPDRPQARRTGFWRVLGALERVKNFVMANTTMVFLGIVVLITLGFLGNQLYVRISASRSTQENTTYVGMDRIGEVYLADEDA